MKCHVRVHRIKVIRGLSVLGVGREKEKPNK